MSVEPIHNFYGTPLSDWIERIPNELEDDAVGLWQIIPVLRLSFGLSGAELEHRAREAIHLLLARGAGPIIGAETGKRWERVTRYGNDPSSIVDGVIADWHTMGRDPSLEDMWFALPDFLNGEQN